MPLRRPRHQTQVTALALASGLPALAATCVLLWTGPYTDRLRWTVLFVVACAWLIAAWMVRERVVRPGTAGAQREVALAERAQEV